MSFIRVPTNDKTEVETAEYIRYFERVLVRLSIAVKRYHDNNYSYKERTFN